MDLTVPMIASLPDGRVSMLHAGLTARDRWRWHQLVEHLNDRGLER